MQVLKAEANRDWRTAFLTTAIAIQNNMASSVQKVSFDTIGTTVLSPPKFPRYVTLSTAPHQGPWFIFTHASYNDRIPLVGRMLHTLLIGIDSLFWEHGRQHYVPISDNFIVRNSS